MLNILQDLQEKFHLTYFFIAHDLAVVRYISSRVAIMYLRRIVEPAETDELFVNPRHPYTEVLVSVVPLPDPDFNTGCYDIIAEVAFKGGTAELYRFTTDTILKMANVVRSETFVVMKSRNNWICVPKEVGDI